MAAPLFETVRVHIGIPCDQPNHRIPALLRAPNNDLLLFTERRNDGIGDVGDFDIVLMRSSDRGRTWSGRQIVFDDAKRTSTDLTPCIDRVNGRIYLFFLLNKKKYAYLTSDDSGFSWSGPVVIHESVTRAEWERVGLPDDVEPGYFEPGYNGLSPAASWQLNWEQRYGVGPGAGAIQLKRGPRAGRILVPARHRENGPTGNLLTYTHVFYSDDFGATWQLGPNVALYGSECQLVELPSGDIVMNMRNERSSDGPSSYNRWIAYSRDDGDSWEPAYKEDALVATRCHASIELYDFPSSEHNGLLLFSNPASQFQEPNHPYGRYNMSVRWSADEGVTWSAARTIYPHTSSYSDLAVLDDGTIGIVYERGPAGSVKYWAEIHFARFNLEWMFGGAEAPAAQVPPAR